MPLSSKSISPPTVKSSVRLKSSVTVRSIALTLVKLAVVPVTVAPLIRVVNLPLTELTVVPVKVVALRVEPSIAPPVMLVPLMVPETVAFC